MGVFHKEKFMITKNGDLYNCHKDYGLFFREWCMIGYAHRTQKQAEEYIERFKYNSKRKVIGYY